MFLRSISAPLLMLLLCLPGLANAEEEYWEYTFRPGDSIWKVAKEYTNTVDNWSKIQKINEIRRGTDRKIRPGTRIVIPVSMLKQQPVPAIVIAVNGDMSVLRADGKNENLIVGTKLYSGDRLSTKKGQNMRMQFADKSELQVLQSSVVVLDKLSHHKQTGMVDTRIRLNTGSVNTWVEKQKENSRYEIKTPAAITAVRGTSFRLSSDDNQISRTEVTGGVVAVSSGQVEKNVKDGFGIVAEKGKPLPEPVKLLPAPTVSVSQLHNKFTAEVLASSLVGAKYYRYQVATDENFNNIMLDKTLLTNKVELQNLRTGTYYLHVRGVDQYALGGADSSSQFEIKPVFERIPIN